MVDHHAGLNPGTPRRIEERRIGERSTSGAVRSAKDL
jgi:hypothetical protein